MELVQIDSDLSPQSPVILHDRRSGGPHVMFKCDGACYSNPGFVADEFSFFSSLPPSLTSKSNWTLEGQSRRRPTEKKRPRPSRPGQGAARRALLAKGR